MALARVREHRDGQWLARVSATPWQYEGYAYLGLGVLALCALCLPWRGVRWQRTALVRHRLLAAIAVGAAVLALGSHVFFGGHELLHYQVPRCARWVSDQFRSPGRFVWIPIYTLLILVLHRALAQLRFAVVVLLVALQVVDASGD